MDIVEKYRLLEGLLKTNVFADGMAPLARDALAAIEVSGDRFLVANRDEGQILLRESKLKSDLTFRISDLVLRELAESPPAVIPLMGVQIFRMLVDKDPNRKSSVSIHAGVLDLIQLGCLSVLTKGGTNHGFFVGKRNQGLAKIREVISKLKAEYV